MKAEGPKRRLAVAIVGGPDVGLRKEMVDRLQRYFRLHVFGSAKNGADDFTPIGVPYHAYSLARGMNPWQDIVSFVRLFRYFRTLRPDIVHAYDSKPAILGRLAARLAGVPIIVGTLPGMGSLYADERLRTRLIRVPYETLQRAASRVSKLTVVQTEDDRVDVIRRSIVSSYKVVVIPGSGVDTDEFRPNRLLPDRVLEIRESLGIEAGTTVVTMVARIIRAKGVLDYADLAKAFANDRYRYHFLLVGSHDDEGPDRLNATELATLRASLHWLGARKDVADILAVTDIFVLPSYYMEGIPRALLEAAATGLPIVTTDIRGCREVVKDGESGILIEPRSPLALRAAVALLDNAAIRSRFGSAARSRVVANFDIEEVCRKLVDAYFALAKQDL